MSLNNDVQHKEDNTDGRPHGAGPGDYVEEKFSREAYGHLRKSFPRVAELPFDSDRKCMTTIHSFPGGFIAFSKGAVEYIADILEPECGREKILQDASALSSEGIRVLAYGYRVMEKIPQPFHYEDVEKDLSFAGLTGMVDPPREKFIPP